MVNNYNYLCIHMTRIIEQYRFEMNLEHTFEAIDQGGHENHQLFFILAG